MPKTPTNWPVGVLPRRLSREWAAFYCGVSPNKFDAGVVAGIYPAVDREGKYDRRLLDKAIDHLNGIAEPSTQENWTVKRDGHSHSARS